MITSTACRFFPFLGLLVRVPWPRLCVAMFRPCASLRMLTQCGGHGTRSAPVQPLADLLTYLLTYSLTYWMTDLTICAKASRARRYPCWAIALRQRARLASLFARQESRPPRLDPGWGPGWSLNCARHSVGARLFSPGRRNSARNTAEGVACTKNQWQVQARSFSSSHG